MSSKPESMTLGELAIRLKKSEMTISRWLRSGVFKGAYRDGPTNRSPWVIPVESVDDYERRIRQNASA